MGRGRCGVISCNKHHSVVKLFGFPRTAQRAEMWRKFCRNPSIESIPAHKLHDFAQICKFHFSTSQYQTEECIKLNRNAVPTILPPGFTDSCVAADAGDKGSEVTSKDETRPPEQTMDFENASAPRRELSSEGEHFGNKRPRLEVNRLGDVAVMTQETVPPPEPSFPSPENCSYSWCGGEDSPGASTLAEEEMFTLFSDPGRSIKHMQGGGSESRPIAKDTPSAYTEYITESSRMRRKGKENVTTVRLKGANCGTRGNATEPLVWVMKEGGGLELRTMYEVPNEVRILIEKNSKKYES